MDAGIGGHCNSWYSPRKSCWLESNSAFSLFLRDVKEKGLEAKDLTWRVRVTAVQNQFEWIETHFGRRSTPCATNGHWKKAGKMYANASIPTVASIFSHVLDLYVIRVRVCISGYPSRNETLWMLTTFHKVSLAQQCVFSMFFAYQQRD